LAHEVISLCEAARLPKAADELTQKAVDAGNEVPELLIRYADRLARTHPAKALAYYHHAAQGDWPPTEVFIKLGQAYHDLGQTAVAESCWRRAARTATPAQRSQILRLMGLPEPAGKDGLVETPDE
jgi:hypothetical protein